MPHLANAYWWTLRLFPFSPHYNFFVQPTLVLHPTFLFISPFALISGFIWELKMLSYWIYAVLVLTNIISCLQNAVPVYTPTSSTWDYPFLNSLINTWHYWHYWTLFFFFLACPNFMEEVFQDHFTFYFSDYNEVWVAFHIYQPFFYILATHLFNNQRLLPILLDCILQNLSSYLNKTKQTNKNTQNISHFQYFGTSLRFHKSSKVTWGSAVAATSSCNALRYNFPFPRPNSTRLK